MPKFKEVITEEQAALLSIIVPEHLEPIQPTPSPALTDLPVVGAVRDGVLMWFSLRNNYRPKFFREAHHC